MDCIYMYIYIYIYLYIIYIECCTFELQSPPAVNLPLDLEVPTSNAKTCRASRLSAVIVSLQIIPYVIFWSQNHGFLDKKHGLKLEKTCVKKMGDVYVQWAKSRRNWTPAEASTKHRRRLPWLVVLESNGPRMKLFCLFWGEVRKVLLFQPIQKPYSHIPKCSFFACGSVRTWREFVYIRLMSENQLTYLELAVLVINQEL